MGGGQRTRTRAKSRRLKHCRARPAWRGGKLEAGTDWIGLQDERPGGVSPRPPRQVSARARSAQSRRREGRLGTGFTERVWPRRLVAVRVRHIHGPGRRSRCRQGRQRHKVKRITCALDCGIAINPNTIEAQVQSAIVYGLSAALYGQITLKDGRVEQSNFHDYQALRINEMPVIEVHVVQSSEAPGGMGEPGTCALPPAVTNAIFAVTGVRLRKLPIDTSKLRA
ncbi:MAG TPA: molybdopterin cofactor-binding domain-containing protein [Methyloceanibacter sp.]|nr:molybdopterin cofactor-binding domain-containing protein [Methyloceanibacter sp.]